MNSLAATRTATLRVVMEVDYDDFVESKTDQFLADLAEVLGCSDEDIQSTSFRPGCVVSETKANEIAIRILLELIETSPDGTLTSNIPQIRALIAKYNIKNITADQASDLRIVVDKKPRQQLVFVHGWQSNASAFGKLPEYLNDMFDSHVEPFEYPTSKFGHSPSIFHLARALENHIRTHATADRVGIIAHSMGGIIVRKMLVLQRDRKSPLDDLIRQATFIASPQLGSSLARILRSIPGFDSDQLHELSPSSGFIAELNDQWQNWKERMTPLPCRVRCIYGTDDSVVPSADASADDREAVPILGADHSSVIRPVSRKSEIILTLARFLREAEFRSSESTSGESGTNQRPSS